MRIGDLGLAWRLRKRDPEACRELIRRHHRSVFGHLTRLGADPSLAEDLTQETYSKAWRGIETLRRSSSLRSWLLTIARNEFFQHLRSREPEAAALDALPEPADRRPWPDSEASAAERDRGIREAMDRLDPVLRETVALHYFQDLSIKEVSEVLTVPCGTVKSRLNRALRTLRERLEEEAPNHERRRTEETAPGGS